MKNAKKYEISLFVILAAAVFTALLFSWSFVEWEVLLYGVSVALMVLTAAAAFILLILAAGRLKGAAVGRGLLCAVVYILVIEGVTLLVNNVLLKGRQAWVAALTVTALNAVLYLVLSMLIAKRCGFSAGKKALCVLLCLCVLCAGFWPASARTLDWFYSKSNRKVASPVGFSSYTPASGDLVQNADYYVAPDGSDDNDGSFEMPFATLERARDAVRETDKAGKTGVTVAVKAGEYRVNALRFESQDSGTPECPITYCAYGDGEVVLNGGVTLDPAAFSPVTDEEMLSRLPEAAREHVRVLDLSALGVTAEQYGRIYAIGSYNTAAKYDGDYTGPLHCELFVNDRRYNLACYPNADLETGRDAAAGWLRTGEVVEMGTGRESNGSTTVNPNWDELRNPPSDIYKLDDALAARINGWKTLNDVWVFGFFKYTWADSSSPIGAFDYENRTFSPRFVSVYGAIEGAPYYFFNVFDELDAPGEWYLDRENGKLYLYAPEGFADASVDLSLSTETLVEGDGVNHLTFRGFTLKGTRGDALRFTGDNNTVERCLIKNVAGTAILLYGRNNAALDNEITRTGKAGILLSGGDPDTLEPGNNRAVNNLVHDWSEIYQTYQPAVSLYGAGNLCAHNEIWNSPHEAITYSGPNQTIEYNLIHDVCLISDDAGAIYAGRNWSSYGCVIRYNAIFDLGTPGEHEPQGIYMDDGLSGQTIYGNLLVNMPCLGIQLGGGRDYDVRNNIVVNSKRYGVEYDQRAIDGVLRNGWFGHCDEMWAELNTHPWQEETWRKAFPQYKGLHFDESRSDDAAFFPNAAGSVISGNLFVNARGTVGNIADNPSNYSTVSDNGVYRLSALKKLFADPDNGDYTLLADSSFMKEHPGFEQLPLSEIGRISDIGE